jgi:hypothetical protein
MLGCEFFSDIFRTYSKDTYFNAYILILLVLILFTRLNRMYCLRVGIVQSVPCIAAIVWSNERPHPDSSTSVLSLQQTHLVAKQGVGAKVLGFSWRSISVMLGEGL